MVVQRSPFSRQNVVTNTGYGFDEDGNPIYTRNDGTVVLLSGSSVGKSKGKTTFAEEESVLERQTKQAVAEITRNRSLNAVEKIKSYEDLQGIVAGKSQKTSSYGPLGSALKAIVSAPASIAKNAFNLYDTVVSPFQQVGSSAINEFSEGLSQILRGDTYYTEGPNKGKQRISSLSDFVKQAKTKDFNAFDINPTGHKKVDVALGFGLDTVFDPTTYLTLGASAASRSTRFALANEMFLKSAKYPELKPLINNIARYGASEIPKNIRDAEGIVSGVKYFGKAVPYTSGLAKAWRYSLGELRARTGDILLSGKTGKYIASKTAPESIRGLVGTGLGRKSFSAVGNSGLAQELMETSASRAAKGTYTPVLRKATAGIEPTIVAARELGKVDATISKAYNIVENPTLSDTVSKETADIALAYRAWEDGLAENLRAAQRQLGDNYDIVVREMGQLEDHLYHKITPEAKDWMFTESLSKPYGYGASSELSARDLIEGQGTTSYRKYRKPVTGPDGKIINQEEFLGEKIFKGTIEEMNEISMRKIGVKWFEDDLGVIAQGYAESIARAHSRIAYVNRAMEYGPEAIKPLFGKVVKDPELVAKLTAAATDLIEAQKILKKKIKSNLGKAGTREAVAGEVDNALRLAQSVLDGKLFDSALTDSELTSVKSALNRTMQVLEDAREASMSMSREQRGEFNDVWGGLLREAEKFRSAINSNNSMREIALKDLRLEYARIVGDDFDSDELVGRSAEWFAERIVRAKGGGRAVTREQIRLQKRMDYLRSTLDDLPVDDAATRDVIEGQIVDIEEQLDGARYLSDAREQASYASDGVIFGSVPMPDEGPAPFQLFTTKAVDDEFGTFSQMDDSIMGFAIPENQLIDFRDPEQLLRLLDPEDIADSVNRAWRGAGIEDATWSSVVRDSFEAGKVDDLFEQVSPAKAALLQGMIDFNTVVRQKLDNGVDMTAKELEDFFSWFEYTNQHIAREFNPDQSDAVARQIFNDWMRGVVEDASPSGYSGVLVPMRNMAPDLDDIGGEWAVLLPNTTPPPVIGGSYSDEWQLVKDNPLAEQILRGTKESYELDLLAKGDALKQQGLDTMALAEARQGLEEELTSLAAEQASLQTLKTVAEPNRIVVDGVSVPVKKVKKSLATVDEFARNQYDNINKQVDRVVEEKFGVAAAQADRIAYEDRLLMLLDSAKTLGKWDANIGTLLRQEIADMTMLLSAKPAKGSTAASNASWIRDVKRVMDSSKLLNDVPEVKEAFERVMTMVFSDEAALARTTANLEKVSFKLSEAEAGKIGRYIYDKADEGWQELRGMGVQVPDEVARMWAPNLKKLYDAKEAGPFFKMMDAFNAQWKKRVTASVGFFVRNGVSAQIMNYADGVSNAHMREGLRWAMAQNDSAKKLAAGDNYGNWMAQAGIVGDEAVAEAELVERIVAASGRGVSDDMALPTVGLEGPKGNVISRADNKYLGFFSKKNDFVERAVRYPMAIDSVRRGLSFDEAVARISRVHFDYSDLSKVDEKMKRYVPFWIWTSRNIPLQLGQIMTRPKVYYEYERIKQELPADSNLMIPKWIADQGPLGVAAGVLLTPDLPWTKLQKNMADIADPRKLLGQASPVIKVPIENWLAKRQLGIDVGPFGPDKKTSGYVDKVLANFLEDLTGSWATSRDKDNNLLMDPRVIYTIENALPPLAQAFRLTGGKLGGKDTLEERWRSSLANWLGIPLREIGPEQQRGEAIRRQFGVKDLLKDLEQISGQKIANLEPEQP
jgi:hypothetical protein